MPLTDSQDFASRPPAMQIPYITLVEQHLPDVCRTSNTIITCTSVRQREPCTLTVTPTSTVTLTLTHCHSRSQSCLHRGCMQSSQGATEGQIEQPQHAEQA